MRFREHAIERARERYDLRLTDKLIREIEQQIKAGKAHLLEKEDRHRAIYLVELADATYPFVWDRTDKLIVTVLPHHTLKRYPEQVKDFYRKKGKRLKHDSRHKKDRLKRRR